MTSNVSPHTTACTGPSNSAFASLMTSSRDVHGGMCVSSSSATPACGRGPTGLGARQMQLGRPRRRMRPRRLAQEHVGAAGQIDQRVAVAGVAAVDQRRAGRIGDPHPVGLGRMAHQPRHHRKRTDLHRLVVDPVPDVEDVGEVVDLPALGRRRRAQPRPRVRRAVHHAALVGRRRVVAPPHEQAGQVEAVVGMQVREQHVHRVGIGVTLQRAEHSAPEIDDQRRRVGGGKQGSQKLANQARQHCRSNRVR